MSIDTTGLSNGIEGWTCECGLFRPIGGVCTACGGPKRNQPQDSSYASIPGEHVASYTPFLLGGVTVANEREAQYGDAVTNMADICIISFHMFGHRYIPSEICEQQIATKTAREKFKKKKDNRLDTVNYHAMRDACLEAQELISPNFTFDDIPALLACRRANKKG